MNTRNQFTILLSALFLTIIIACGGGGGGGSDFVPPTNPPTNPPAPTPTITVSLNQIITDCATNAPTNNVVALVTVNDQNGNPVDSLTSADFTLFEGVKQIFAVGSPECATQDCFTVNFENRITIPLSVAVVLDFSWSIGGVNGDGPDLAAEKAAAVGFVNLLLDDDEAEIVKFGRDIDRAIDFTPADAVGKQELATAINEPLAGDGNGSAVYDAIILALEDTALRQPDRGKAVVIVTDGEDTSSQSTIDDVIARANLDGIPVFTIGLGDELVNFEANLKRIADETGGVFYPSLTADDLTDIYNQLAKTLILNQYVFQYNSALASGTPTDLMVEATYNTLVDSDTRNFTLCP